MKKSYIFWIIAIILVAIGVGIFIYRNTNNNVSKEDNLTNFSYNSTKVSSTDNSVSNQENNENVTNNSAPGQESTENATDNSISNQDNSTNSTGNSSNEQNSSNSSPEDVPTETEISTFSTKIYTKDSDRQNNISITCSSLNDTYVENGATFSFCDTVGKATTSKGYEKADVFKDGEVVQALGGGNCQVSSTLYNAVIAVEGLDVTERHEHSNSVPYVSKGKDAAVAYGSYDFKFVNNTGNKIKITSSNDNNNVYIKIFKVE